MMLTRKGVVRLLWLVHLSLLLAVLLPGLLGHPYPRPIGPYIVWGGLLLYVIGGICLAVFSGRLRKLFSK